MFSSNVLNNHQDVLKQLLLFTTGLAVLINGAFVAYPESLLEDTAHGGLRKVRCVAEKPVGEM